ncbi:MAG: hypothetical protein WC581_13990 [Thermodesulfovibrionales bacterium]
MIVVIMEKIPCGQCGRYFIPDPRQKNPRYCGEEACQRARKAAWQREKMIRDPVYRANQKQSQADWQSRNADYWKLYRAAHPEQAERNRDLQKVRNKHRHSRGVVKMDALVIAKMDASRSGKTSVGSWLPGSFWLVPVIAKMDAIKVILHRIPST